MDPSIMKLLEEDEDETMHSGADVDAFQAALNRDIVGDASTSQPSDSDTAVLSCEIKQSPSQPFLDWQTTSQGENASGPSQQQQQQEQHISVTEIKQHGSAAENQQLQNNVRQMSSHLSLHQKELQDDVQQGQTQQMSIQTPQLTGMEISERNSMSLPELEKMQNLDTGSQYLKIKKMVTQQATATEQPGNLKNQVKPIPFMLLLPTLNSHLDKDREMQLQTLFNKMRKNEIKNEQFVRLMRSIAGEQVFKLALEQVQLQMQSQAFAHQSITRTPGASASSAVQVHADYPSAEKSVQKPREVYCQPDSHGMQTSSSSSASIVNQDRERPSIPVPGHRKQQQHLHFPQSSFLMHGNNTATYHPYSGANVYTSGSPMKQQPHDLQIRKSSHQTMGAIRMGGSTHTMNIMNMPKFERKNSITDPSRLQKGSISQYTNKSALQQSSVPWQAPTNKQVLVEQATEQPYKSQLSNPQSLSATLVDQGNAVPGNMKDESLEKHPSKVGFSPPTSMVPSNSVSPSIANKLDPNVPVGSQIPSVASSAGVNAKTPPKKPSVAQKKPLEALDSSPPVSSKKQKVSGQFSDQSIEQLNDVTAVSGVNLREEEEQLFSGSKEDCRVSETSRMVVQEEEERLILQKIPLKKRLAEIMSRYRLKNINDDAERCLSLVRCALRKECGD
ncbi:transcription initiation factor TFIID subunit 4b [Jatropha curcas]|uniref:transcription initiation factor TFIID subunit 4b n=1 Tax=Jatropha curcas TaxID=180498 RepID=UPI0018951A25|nr:transcription initiation factor TFIID subunit 4b [Jatropha curcas]